MASNFISLFLTALFSFASFILAVVGCAGSTKNYNPLNKIFAAQVDLTNIQLANVLPATASLAAATVREALPEKLNLGLWSYCLADASGAVESCTSPSGIQKFNLNQLLFNNIKDNSVLKLIDSLSSIVLPEKLEDKMSYYNGIVKCMFITLLIGIVLQFITLVITIIRWIIHIRVLKFFGVFFSLFAFLSLLISIGTCMGTYIYINHILKADYSEYGITVKLGKVYLAVLWASVGCSLLTIFCWASVRSNQKEIIYVHQPIEEKPLFSGSKSSF